MRPRTTRVVVAVFVVLIVVLSAVSTYFVIRFSRDEDLSRQIEAVQPGRAATADTARVDTVRVDTSRFAPPQDDE